MSALAYHYDEESGPPMFCPSCDACLTDEAHYDDCEAPMSVRKEWADAINARADQARYFGCIGEDAHPFDQTQPVPAVTA